MLCDLWPYVIQYSPSPFVFLSLNHLSPDISSHLAHLYKDFFPPPKTDLLLSLHLPHSLLSSLPCLCVFQGPSSSVLKLPWTTSPRLWATQPSFSAVCPATRRPLCVGWRTTLQWCRSRDGSHTDPRLTDHASASATWTPRTQAISSVWPPTPRAPSPRQACSLSNSVRRARVRTVAPVHVKLTDADVKVKHFYNKCFTHLLWQTVTFYPVHLFLRDI